MKRAIFFLTVGLLLNTHYSAMAQIITTIAGSGSGLESGDGGAATAAHLEVPFAIALDTAGNMLIVDYSGNCVRKVNTSGIISTFAGKTSWGYSGDGGPATAAQFERPTCIAIDKVGNVYIGDGWNQCVRKVGVDGIIHTVVGDGNYGDSGDGGPATSARLGCITGLAFDTTGNLYVSDSYNSRVRRVSPSGIITAFAGAGGVSFGGDGGPAIYATFEEPSGLAVDKSGNVYIADLTDNRVRKVDADGIITTFAGNGTAGLAGDGGAATAASLWGPTDVGIDKHGNLYIVDQYTSRIRKINPAGIITTYAGIGTGLFSGAFSGDGGPANAAELYHPSGLKVDDSDNVYIADSYNYRIRKVTYSAVSVPVVPESQAAWSCYPNPVSATNLMFIDGLTSPSAFCIFNALGQAVHRGNIEPAHNAISLKTLPAGAYIVEVNESGKKKRCEIVKE